MHTLARALAVAILLGTVVSCESTDDSGGAGGEPTARDERIPFTPQDDVQFIDGMVPHHMMAIDMADQVLARGSDPDVRALAQRIKDAQAAEIGQMKGARRELSGSDVVPDLADPHALRQMEEMVSLSGDLLDHHFLRNMLGHHAGAIQMAVRALPNLQRADLRLLAEKILMDQAKEIGDIHRMLQQR